MAIRFFILFLLTSSSALYSQIKGDYYWAMGHDFGVEEGVQSYCLDFSKLPMVPEQRNEGLEFGTSSASICDSEGKLLFYTNGCRVANRNHDIMVNGDSINYNTYYSEWLNDCDDSVNGYNELQGILILPDPNDNQGYYIIHKPYEKLEGISGSWQEYLKFSYVDLTKQDGLGEVILKNEVILNVPLQVSFLSAMKHENGNDWWIICRGENNNDFHKVLLTKDGFENVEMQSIGLMPTIDFETIAKHGNAKFSPDGTKYAFFNLHDGLSVFDFDRSSGILSNGRYLDWTPIDEFNWFGSVEFSPNSRFVYVTNSFFLYQIDLQEPDIEDGLILIDEWDGTNDPFPTTFFVQALGPDCKIYIRPGSSSNVFHTIHEPNRKGLECGFVQRDVLLPVTSEAGAFPNFPRFRVDEENKCDPTITSMFGEQVKTRNTFEITPSPVNNTLYLRFSKELEDIKQYSIIDLSGREVRSGLLQDNSINVSSLESGLYIIRINEDYAKKFIKI